MPLFNEVDPWVNEERRLAWLYKIDLLVEWGRFSEHWRGLVLNVKSIRRNVAAQALKSS